MSANITNLSKQGTSGSRALLNDVIAPNTIHVTVLRDRHDIDTSDAHSPTWDELATELITHVRSEHKNNGAIVFGRFVDGPCTKLGRCTKACPGKNHRIDDNVIEMTALGLDFDKASEDQLCRCFQTIEAKKLKHVWYTTFSSSETQLKIRIVIALSRPVSGADWERFWNAAIDHLDVQSIVDKSCVNASRVFYRPCCPEGATPLAEAVDGQPLDVDAVMALAAPALSVAARSEGQANMYPPASPELLAHARERLREHGPAVQGQRGDSKTRTAWGILINNLALSDDEARELISGYNATCVPPWDLDDLFNGPARSDQSWDDSYGGERDAWEMAKRLTSAPAFARQSVRTYEATDLGNAERFVAEHHDVIRYVHDWKRWIIWNGMYWKPDDEGAINRLIHQTVHTMGTDAAALPIDQDGETRRKRAMLWATRSEDASKMSAIERVARDLEPVVISPENLDADPWLFNVTNGTIDLRTGSLRAHSPTELITKISPIEYDPNAVCPLWDSFITKVFPSSQGLRDFVQRAVGYSLTGSPEEHCMFILFGKGCNGKSTFIETCRAILGQYGCTAEMSAFVARKGDAVISNEIAALEGMRFTTAAETEHGRALAESLIKSVTGGDTIKARKLYREGSEFRAVFKLWLSTNHKPIIRGTDDGIWRRLKLIPFTYQFTDDEKDLKFAEKLKQELPGVLAWAIRGLVQWNQSGLKSCSEVDQAVQVYRTEMDPIGPFLEESCVIDPAQSATGQALYMAYQVWCSRNNCHAIPTKQFGDRLAELGFMKTKMFVKSQHLVTYKGIGLAVSPANFLTGGSNVINSNNSSVNPN